MVPAAHRPEMGLELKLCATWNVGGFLGDLSPRKSGESGRAAKLEESIKRFQEEKRKIEAFKRELPLCVHLITDVIEELNRELEQCRGDKSGRLFEEFIPVKSKVVEDARVEAETNCKETNCKDKMDWMSSVQLWSDSYAVNNDHAKNRDEFISEEKDAGDHGKGNLSPECKALNCRGAVVPFKGLSPLSASLEEEEKPDLCLRSPAINSTLGLSSSRYGSKAAAEIPESSPETTGAHLSLHQPSSKTRRCWSQELHRRFVLAIQQLGGPQVATPKQIREYMKVDGLTNDEVKSHLQKYRIRTKRVSNSSAKPARSNGVNGGEQCSTSSSQQSVSQSPHSPFHLAGSSYALSVTAGDSSEEEGKSESFLLEIRKDYSLRCNLKRV